MIALRQQTLACLLTFAVACSSAPRRSGDYKIALVPARAGQHGIFVMNSDTTGGKLLTPEVTAQLRPSSWSPDGKKIVFFASRFQDSDILGKFFVPNHSPLYIMDASGGNQKRLLDFPVSDFGWSPDSRELFFVSSYEAPGHDESAVSRGAKAAPSAIYVLNLPTGKARKLTGFGQNCSAAWAPDGARIAISFGDGQNSGIYVLSLDGQQGKRLTNSSTMDIRPVWSPNGKMIAYVAVPMQGGDLKDAGVYVIDTDGVNKRRVTDKLTYQVSWSLDGTMLLLQSTSGIDLVDPLGKKEVHLTAGIDRALDGVFTPDGRDVIFRSQHEGEWNLYLVNLSGENRKRITGQLSASTFCLSPLRAN